MPEIFSSDNLSVVETSGSRADIWVTFGYFGGGEPFGLTYLNSLTQAGLFVVAKKNHWFQHAEIWDALRTVRERMEGVPGKRILYGSSMGGFGALGFSDYLEATHVIAAAPQISIKAELVGGFDRRWTDIGERLVFQLADARSGLSQSARITLIYDSLHSIDRVHAKLYSTFPNVATQSFHGSGHHILYTLQDLGLLKPLLLAATCDQDSPTAIGAILDAYKSGRASSAYYFYALATRHFDNGRYARSLVFYALAMERPPFLSELYPKYLLAARKARDQGVDVSLHYQRFESILATMGLPNFRSGMGSADDCRDTILSLQAASRVETAEDLASAGMSGWPTNSGLLRTASWLHRLRAFTHLERGFDLSHSANEQDPDSLPWQLDAVYGAVLLNRLELARSLYQSLISRFPRRPEIEEFERMYPVAKLLLG